MAGWALHLVRGGPRPRRGAPPSRRPRGAGEAPAVATVRVSVTPPPYASGVAELNPQQRDVRDELLLYGQERPTPDRELGRALRQRAIEELTALGHGLDPSDWIRVDKHRLSQAHTCTGYLRARSAEDFSWSVANVRGKVLHRALEGLIMSAYRRAPPRPAHAALHPTARAHHART